MKVYYLLVSAFCVWIKPTHSQFFYSHYTPLPTQFSPVFHQTFLPPIPLAYNVPQTQAATVTYNLPPVQKTEYRGFGYHTDYKDGASSTVYYVTGPESDNLRNFKDFPNFSRKIQEASKARSLASDILDVNAVPDASGKIRSILQPSDFQKLFDDAMSGVINFYSYPAGTVPLTRSSENVSESTTTAPTTTTTTTTTASEEAIAAESVVNTRIAANEVDNSDKTIQTTEANPVTETKAPSENSEAIATTENSENVSEEATTIASGNDETTTLETTTKA